MTILFNLINMANNRGRVEEKRPSDEDIADYTARACLTTVLVVWIILDHISYFDFHDLLNVECDYSSCRTINLNLVKIKFCLPKVFLDYFILRYYNSGELR